MSNVSISSNKENLNAIDLMKFIMAIVVVAVHTEPMRDCSSNTLWEIYNIFSSAAVPFFFLASGYLLGRKFSFTNNDIAVINSKINSVIYMYVFWSFVYFPLAAFAADPSTSSIGQFIISYARNFFFLGESYNSWPLWYLLSSLYALLFIRFCLKCNFSILGIFLLGFAFVSCSFKIDSYFYSTSELVGIIPKLIQSTIMNGRLLRGFFYIPMGMFLSQKRPSFFVSLTFSVLGYLIAVLSDGYLSGYAHLMMCSGLFLTVTYIKLPDSKIYRMLRNLSTDMYFLHMWVWTAYYTIMFRTKTFGFNSFVVTVIACIFISICKSKLNHLQKNS